MIPLSPSEGAAFGAALVSGLLLLQFAHRRRPFILIWSAGWLLIAPAMLVIAHHYTSPIAAAESTGLSQLLGICTATLFFLSGDVYRQTHLFQRRQLKALVAAAVWFVFSPLIFGDRAVLVPGYLVMVALMAGAGAMYAALLLERRMIGAGLVSFVFFGLAVSNVTTAYMVPRHFGTAELSFGILVVNAVLYACGALGVHLLVFEDMTYELRATNRRLEIARAELLQAAITDPLTGCHNRRFLDQVIERELQRHERFSLPLSLLFIDVDRFKRVNDTFGHDVGDAVLQYVARFLKRHIREADYVFRWGGDEFLVLITCTAEEAQRKGAALKAKFDAAPETTDLPPGLGLSVGWASVPVGTTDLIRLVHEADARMYHDKAR